MTTAIVLAGHGSHISPNTAGVVWQLTDLIRQSNFADEVTAAFWKELPSFHTVFDSLVADDITVVPLFTAQGFFTRQVIPAEMGLSRTITQRDGRIIRYTRTIGEHPHITDVIQRRVNHALTKLDYPPEQVAVALIGHSTKRFPESRKAAEAQAAALRAKGVFKEVVAVFLDDEPSIPQVYQLTTAPAIIAMPYFLASGSHTTIDVPDALGLETGKTPQLGTVNHRQVFYTLPIFVDEDLSGVILELIKEVGAPLDLPGHIKIRSPWAGFPQRGRDLVEHLLEQAPTQFGQIAIHPTVAYHCDETRTPKPLEHPQSLREIVRDDPFRPLATSRDLPIGWSVEIEGDPAVLHAVIETIYPGVIGTTAAVLQRGLAADALKQVIARQQGQFRALADLDTLTCRAITEKICAACLQHPAWESGTISDPAILCREPCNVWLSEGADHVG